MRYYQGKQNPKGQVSQTMHFIKVMITGLIFLCLSCQVVFSQEPAPESISGCHCFNERAFNPADKSATDEYLLATTFNSLLSRSFDLPKRDIVMLKMQGGVKQNDLLIALHAAKVGKTERKDLLSFRTRDFSWQKILSELLPADNFKTDTILQGLQSGHSETEAGQRIADHLLMELFQIPEKILATLRGANLNQKEITLLLILEQTKKLSPLDGVRQHSKEGKSWSEITHQLGVEPADAGELIIDYQANTQKK